MGKPIEQRTRKPLGNEHAGPFVERKVGGDGGEPRSSAVNRAHSAG